MIEGKLRNFGQAYSNAANSILECDENTASAFSALLNGDFDALGVAMTGLKLLGQNAGSFMELGAGVVWYSGDFVDPKAIDLKFELTKEQWKVSGYRAGDGLAPRYKPTSVFKNPKLTKLAAFKALSKVAAPATVVLGVVDAGISYNDEYNRNPYLPEGVRDCRALSAVDLSVKKTSFTVAAGVGGAAAGAAAGAAIGIAAGPVGMIAGALIGLGVGLLLELVTTHDLDGGGKTLTDKYIDSRADAYLSSSYPQDPRRESGV